MDCWVKCRFVNKFYGVKSRSEDLVNSFINIFLMNIAFWGGKPCVEGLGEGSCSFADYLVTSVHLRGSPENVLFPESISDKKSGIAARDGWKIRISRVLTGWLSFAD
jgi:hypothetical protein